MATTVLIVRVLLQKQRVGQRAIWRRNRKMVVQLASISVMYIIVWIPSVVCFVIPLIVPSPFTLELATGVLNYFQYVSYLCCPFMCLVGLPEIRELIKQRLIQLIAVQPLAQNPTESDAHRPDCRQQQTYNISRC